MEKLFCVEIELSNGESVVHHTVATDSQQAFKNTEMWLSFIKLQSKGMKCQIINQVDGYTISFSK